LFILPKDVIMTAMVPISTALATGEALIDSFRELESAENSLRYAVLGEQQAQIYLNDAHERMRESRQFGRPMDLRFKEFGMAQDSYDMTQEKAAEVDLRCREARNMNSKLVFKYTGAVVIAHRLNPDEEEPVFFKHPTGDSVEQPTVSGVLKTGYHNGNGIWGHALLLESSTPRAWVSG
jgi:hypothetical protein